MKKEAPSLRYLIISRPGEIVWDSKGSAEACLSFLSVEEKSPLPVEALFLMGEKGLRCYTSARQLVDVFLSPLNGHLGAERFLVTVLAIDEVLFSHQAAAQIRLRETIGSVIAGFAHEVRNPLAAIASLVELCLMYADGNNELTSSLAKISPLLFRIEQLLRSALTYGRPKPPRASWHQLSALLQSIYDSMTLAGVKLHIENWELPKESLPVFTDADHTISIITNLLNNAIQASNEESVRLSVTLDPETDEHAIIDICDQGPGVPTDLRERIFEPFFTTKPKGTGLGLALARDLARLNKGDLLLWKSSPQGSVFRLLLPRRSGSGH